MKRTRLVNFVAATLVGLATAAPISAPADDTEIYTGDNAGSAIRPNVLFILDTSGSMSSFDGQAKDRLDRMKDALNGLLDNVDNVNIGLMRFTDPGGPILFPISPVDGDATAIDQAGQTDVTVRVSDNDDDAEQLIAITTAGAPARLNDVKLDSFYLELLDTPAFGREYSVISAVPDGPGDAEHAPTFYNNNSGTLETVFTAANLTRTVGFRFTDIETVDKDTDGAKVLFSQMRLTSQDARSGALDLKVFGLYARDMTAFPSGQNSPGGCPGSQSNQDIYCRLGLNTVARYNAGLDFDNVANFRRTLGATPGNVTDAIVTWSNVPDTVTDEQIASPDLSPIIQEIFDHPQWQNGSGDDDIGLFYTGTNASFRNIYARDGSTTRRAELQVDYVPAGAPAGRQLVALRFRNVKIPQGATIETAKLELFSVGESSSTLDIRISGENVPNAPTFTAYTAGVASGPAPQQRLSTRLGTNTASKVVWKLTGADKWTNELPVQTPDISAVIKEIVGQGGWCGGNDLVLFLEYDTIPGAPVTRRVHAHDADPSLAATLKVDYDEKAFGPGQGCTVEEITRQVRADKDDAEQDASNGTTYLTSTTMEMTQAGGVTRTNGVIFRNLPVPRGATIESAVVEFTATGAFGAGAASVVVTGQDDDEVQQFESSSYNVSNRIVGAGATTATQAFNIPPAAVANNTRFATPDISNIIGEITSRSDWDSGDEIGLIFTGTGQVDLYTHDSDPSKSALLRLRIRYNVGDVIVGGNLPTAVTVRQRLKEIVDELTHDGYTPIVDTMYEAALYFRGEPILYGASRGNGGSSVERNTRVSHPGTYLRPPGATFYPVGCSTDDSNLNDEACRGQRVLNSPNYISPIKEGCQSNFIVLLTDGEANHNNSAGLVRAKTGVASCITSFSDGSSVVSGETCGVDLAKFLNDVDQAPNVAGNNSVTTYTIGFNISTQFLKDMATEGGGRFFEASSAADLAGVFQSIITDVLSRATSFAAPSLSVNAFNRLEDRNEVYFSLFEPAATARWNGNIKKFQLCQSSTDPCFTISGAEVGDVMDSRSPPIKAVGLDGRILDTALSFWTTTPDGAEVLKGGTGNQMPDHPARRVFTMSDETVKPPGTPPNGTVTFFPSSQNLGAPKNQIVDTNSDGVIDGLTGSAADNLDQTRDLLGLGSASIAELKAQIDWIRGKDVDGVFSDAAFAENRYSFSDPLHGNPLAITYGGTAAAPIIKLLAGTNDGGIRLINSTTGQEEWIFYPPSLLPLQTTLRANPVTAKAYGVDGSATPWIRDAGTVGVIEPTLTPNPDFIRVFIGQRRGGNHYWGLDISPTATIPTADTTTLTHVTPRLMWRIRGGTPEYPLLGDTWSKPFLATMLVGTDLTNQAVRKTVLIFAGGYEPESQDSGFAAANSRGNAIYVADAETGQRLFYIAGPDQPGTADDHGGSTPDRGLRVPDMVYPIPSDVAAFDADGDGTVDRLYVGDTGGQMWRVDFRPNRAAGTSNVGILAIVGKLAAVSSATADADKRKFFYPPSIIQVRGAGSHSNSDYDLVSAVTGNRSNPLNKTVQDRFYAFRDYAIGGFADADNNGLADGYTTIRGDLVGAPTDPAPVPASTFNDMLDFTVLDGPEDLADPSTFTTSLGYYIRLDTGGAGSGEKGLAAPTTLAGKLFFTTYLPEGVVSSATCSLAEGRGQLYGLNAITGAAIFNWDNDSGGNITHGDRVYTLGSGIPSNPVPVFFPEKVKLLVGVGGGAEVVDPAITVPQGRTYWFQQ